jgi:predicted MFS family arabinose efflux permease
MPRRVTDGLWSQPDFLKLWAGQTISAFGSMVSAFALPVTAILLLKATPLHITLLGAAEIAPGLLVSLFAGAWVDRLRRRPVLIIADVGRALLLGSIPAAALLGVLRIELLYVVALLVSVCAVFFDVAYLSYLPSLVRRRNLLEGNSRLQASASAAEVAGFGLGGALVQALTAPIAILVDAVSFLVSAFSVAIIRRPEPAPAQSEWHHGVTRDIGLGIRLVLQEPTLLAGLGASATFNMFRSMVGVVIMLYMIRRLDLSPLILGQLFALGGISAFLGAVVAGPVTRRWGVGPTMLGSLALSGLATFLVPLAGGPLAAVLVALAASQLLGDGASTIYEINQVTLVQSMAAFAMQGRLNASKRFADWAARLLGLLAGGLMGQAVGLRPTLFVAAAGGLLSALWLLFSPVRRLRVLG